MKAPPHNRPEIQTTKRLAALRQIAGAIEHFCKQEFECSITLAAAAEGILPPTNDPHVFLAIKQHLPPAEFRELDCNLVINWLKHYKSEDPEPVEITEFDAVMTLG